MWEEAQLLAGFDPDFHRRDLWDAIEAGALPEYEFGIQVMPDTEDQTFEGIDLLDPTKIVPEEICPVRIIGKMTLDANPTNFFDETEQVAFHPGHVVRGIDITNDPLLQARLFSYLDTQLTRLGGPNFSQIPINKAVAPVNDNIRDGFAQQAVHEGKAAYSPNTVGGGCPFVSTVAEGGYVHFPQPVAGTKVAERAVSFKDHYSQAALFWNSQSPVEKEHIVSAFSFELSKVETPAIREAMLGNLANVSAELTKKVAANLGVPAPKGKPAEGKAGSSPALSLMPARIRADQRPGGRVDCRRRHRCGRPQGNRQGIEGGGGPAVRARLARREHQGLERRRGPGGQDPVQLQVGGVRCDPGRCVDRGFLERQSSGQGVLRGGVPALQDHRRLGSGGR